MNTLTTTPRTCWTQRPDPFTEVTFIPTEKSFGVLDYYLVALKIRGVSEPVEIEVHETVSGLIVQDADCYPNGLAKLAMNAVETAVQLQDDAEARQSAQVKIAAAWLAGLTGSLLHAINA